VLQHTILLAASLVALFPLWFMLWTAIRSQEDFFRSPLGWPQSIHWDNFSNAFDENIGPPPDGRPIPPAGRLIVFALIVARTPGVPLPDLPHAPPATRAEAESHEPV